MATRTVEVLIDDLDGTPAVQTVPFGLDGVTYEVDLSQENADRLREALDEFIAVSRRTGGRRKAPQMHTDPLEVVANAVPAADKPEQGKTSAKGKKKSRGRGTRSGSATKSTSDPDELRAIRTWAEENGHQVSSRGRIPAAVRAAYEESAQENHAEAS